MAIKDLLAVAGGKTMIPPFSISAGGGGPSRADSSGNYITSAFDSSGWTVATGGSKASSAQGLGASAGGLPWSWILIAAAVGLVVWKKL